MVETQNILANEDKSRTENPPFGQINSVQLNIVTFVDVKKAMKNRKMENVTYMIDNSLGRKGQGTNRLQTVCKQGQVLNWIIYPLDREKQFGQFPVFPKILNIVFINDDNSIVARRKILTEFKIYGGPDKKHDPVTPSYYYWAGTVLSDLKPGEYQYRFVVEFDTGDRSAAPLQLNCEGPSLMVIPITS